MPCKLLLTGFGPFSSVKDNPSEALARNFDKPHHVIDVSYQAARSFIENLDLDSFDQLLLMGVHGTADHLRLESAARNLIGQQPDVTGFIPTERHIRRGGPDVLQGTLWSEVDLKSLLETYPAQRSYDAGRYLCNFIYYEALLRFPEKKIGFLHVPLVTAMPLSRQQEALSHLVKAIEASCGC